jgi:hypothetical protein
MPSKRKHKHIPTETSRCQSSSDLIHREKVAEHELDPFGLNTGAGRWLKAEQEYYRLNTTIPYQGILYKVTTKRSGTRGYLLEELNDTAQVADLVIDLRKLAFAICQPDISDSEADEE